MQKHIDTQYNGVFGGKFKFLSIDETRLVMGEGAGDVGDSNKKSVSWTLKSVMCDANRFGFYPVV